MRLQRDFDRASGGCRMRRTRSSHPWALASRHPWRETVRRNPPSHPPEVACPPCIGTISQWRMTRHRQCLQDISPDVAVSMSTHQRSRVVALPGASGGCRMHRTVTRQGWREASAHGWLERVRRNPPPHPPRFEHHTKQRPRPPPPAIHWRDKQMNATGCWRPASAHGASLKPLPIWSVKATSRARLFRCSPALR